MDQVPKTGDIDLHRDTGDFEAVQPSENTRRPVGEIETNERQITLSPSQRLTGSIGFVRITSQEDVVRSLPIAREFHAESRYSDIPFSEAKFLRVYGSIVTKSDRTFGVLAERDGEIVGVLLAEVGQYFLGEGGQIATNHVLYVSKITRHSTVGGRVAIKLMRLFFEWSKGMGATEVQIHATSGIDPARTDKFLSKLHFRPFGGSYYSVIR